MYYMCVSLSLSLYIYIYISIYTYVYVCVCVCMCIYIYTHIHIIVNVITAIIVIIVITIVSLIITQKFKDSAVPRTHSLIGIAPNLPTNIVDFRGFDSSTILDLRGGIPRPIGIS